MKILCFRHFFNHFVFTDKGEHYRNKELKKYVEVSVVVDIECVDTNEDDADCISFFLA